MTNHPVSGWLQWFIKNQYPHGYCSQGDSDRYVYYAADHLYLMAREAERNTTNHWLSQFMRNQYDCFRQEWYGTYLPQNVLEAFTNSLRSEDVYNPKEVM